MCFFFPPYCSPGILLYSSFQRFKQESKHNVNKMGFYFCFNFQICCNFLNVHVFSSKESDCIEMYGSHALFSFFFFAT